jgi:hypothetical protein
MAIGTRSNWAAGSHLPQGLIYPELVHGGIVETLVQETGLFNAGSRNAIRLVTNRQRGDYSQESFWGLISNLVSRRDPNSSSGATSLVVPKAELISIKVNRKVGPIDQTLDSFRKLGQGDQLEALSFLLGTQIAKAMLVDQLDSALRAVTAAISGQSGLVRDISIGGSPAAGRTLTTTDLVDALAKMGDAANRITCWVMHSKQYFDLVKYQINPANNGDPVANTVVMAASPLTLNRPVLVTDSAALQYADTDASPITTTNYFVAGLVQDSVVVEDSEDELMYSDVITGLENIVVRLQGEFAYNLGVKGFKFNLGSSPMAINPTNAQLASSSNWTKAMTSNKDLAGVLLRCR